MNEKQELIARALEIAIKLTNANENYIFTNEIEKHTIHINEPLFTTLKNVIGIIKSGNLVDDKLLYRTFLGDRRMDRIKSD